VKNQHHVKSIRRSSTKFEFDREINVNFGFGDSLIITVLRQGRSSLLGGIGYTTRTEKRTTLVNYDGEHVLWKCSRWKACLKFIMLRSWIRSYYGLVEPTLSKNA